MISAYTGIKFRYLVLYIVLTIIGLIVGGAIYLFKNGEAAITEVILFSQFALYAVLLLWLMRAYRKNALSLKGLFQPIRRSNGLIKKLLFTAFHISFSISITIFIFYLFSLMVPQFLLKLLEDNTATSSFMTSTTVPSFILVVLVAPVVEELVFRATLLQKLRAKYGNVAGILLSSAIFSLVHMNSGMVGHFTIGVFLCIFYLQTKNIWIPIFCHALNNMIAFFPLTADTGAEDLSLSDTVESIQQYGIYYGLYSLLCLGILIWLAIKLIKRLEKAERTVQPTPTLDA